MRVLGFFIAVCLALAALRAAAIVLALVIIGTLLYGLVTRPAETLGALLGLMLLGAFGQHPIAGMLILGSLLIIGRIAKQRID